MHLKLNMSLEEIKMKNKQLKIIKKNKEQN